MMKLFITINLSILDFKAVFNATVDNVIVAINLSILDFKDYFKECSKGAELL